MEELKRLLRVYPEDMDYELLYKLLPTRLAKELWQYEGSLWFRETINLLVKPDVWTDELFMSISYMSDLEKLLWTLPMRDERNWKIHYNRLAKLRYLLPENLREGFECATAYVWGDFAGVEEWKVWFNETCRLLLELPQERWHEIPGYIRLPEIEEEDVEKYP